MLGQDVAETSKIANVHTYLEQAIGRTKYFNILSNMIPIKYIPLIFLIQFFTVIRPRSSGAFRTFIMLNICRSMSIRIMTLHKHNKSFILSTNQLH